MTRDEIYDHLARVYLGKRQEADLQGKRRWNAWLLNNILIAVIIFAGAFYGLTAFLTQHSLWQSRIIFSLHNGLARLDYDFNQDFSPVKSFSLSVPRMDASRYKNIQFTIRAKDGGTPGILKVVVVNEKGETAFYYIQGMDASWQEYSIPLDEFKQITDWTHLKDISFVLESWNAEQKKGVILIDNICFSS